MSRRTSVQTPPRPASRTGRSRGRRTRPDDQLRPRAAPAPRSGSPSGAMPRASSSASIRRGRGGRVGPAEAADGPRVGLVDQSRAVRLDAPAAAESPSAGAKSGPARRRPRAAPATPASRSSALTSCSGTTARPPHGARRGRRPHQGRAGSGGGGRGGGGPGAGVCRGRRRRPGSGGARRRPRCGRGAGAGQGVGRGRAASFAAVERVAGRGRTTASRIRCSAASCPSTWAGTPTAPASATPSSAVAASSTDGGLGPEAALEDGVLAPAEHASGRRRGRATPRSPPTYQPSRSTSAVLSGEPVVAGHPVRPGQVDLADLVHQAARPTGPVTRTAYAGAGPARRAERRAAVVDPAQAGVGGLGLAVVGVDARAGQPLLDPAEQRRGQRLAAQHDDPERGQVDGLVVVGAEQRRVEATGSARRG